MIRIRFRALAAIVFVLTSSAAMADIHRVDHLAAGMNDGSSWQDAFADLQDALAAADAGDEIWVAEGTYKPTQGLDRSASFELKSGVGIYGGFAGGETLRSQRDASQNLTVLSGDIGAPGNPYFEALTALRAAGSDRAREHELFLEWHDAGRDALSHRKSAANDNSYNVVVAVGVDDAAVLDGFEIVHGESVGDPGGAGLAVVGGNPTIRSCVFREHIACGPNGGAVAIYDGASPSLDLLQFVDNLCCEWGGALCSEASSPEISNSSFEANHGGIGGGVAFRDGGAARLLSSYFLANWADDGGGGVAIGSSNPWIEGTTFDTNVDVGWGGGGLLLEGGSPTLYNSNFIDNYAQGGLGGGAILSSNAGTPLLVNVLFDRNSNYAFLVGGGAFTQTSGQSSIINSTFTRNQSWADLGVGGGALYNGGGEMFVRNCVLFANESALDPDAAEIANAGGDTEVSHSLVDGSGGSGVGWVSALGTDGGGNLDSDPLFINRALGDLRLLGDSPAVDAGNDSFLPPFADTDLAGNSRVTGAAVDMGAYELSGIVRTQPASMSSLKLLFGG